MTATAPRISGPLKWHGGKAYLAKKIVAMMPPHLHYVEPYAGGLSVLLAKPPEGKSEVVNDLNGWLTNFWRVLADPDSFEKFHRRILAVPFSEREWNDASTALKQRPDLAESDPVAAALAFFITCRLSLAGRMACFATLSRNRTRSAMNEQASAWINAVEGLPAVHSRLRRVAVLHRPALDVIRQQDGELTLYYLDPPYLHETRSTTGEYAHEMDESEHTALLQAISKIEGKFLLSGYRSDLYDTFAIKHGWNRTDFELPNNAASGSAKRRMIECVWSNC